MSNIETNLKKLGIIIPEAMKAVANYVGFVKTGNQIFISGQLPFENGELKYIGKVGSEISTDDAKKAARLCMLNAVAQLKLACQGDLSKVAKCVKLGVYVNSESDYTDQSSVANGASDLVVEVFGDAGKHTRAAVGMVSLPRGVAVEVDAIFEVRAS